MVAHCVFGVEGKLLSWIEPFLLYKKQLVTVNGVYSLFTLILSGVTQDSVLARFSSSFTFTIFKIVSMDQLPAALLMTRDSAKLSAVVRTQASFKRISLMLSSGQEGTTWCCMKASSNS